MIIFRTEERLCDGCCYKQGEFRLIFKDAVIHLCVDCLDMLKSMIEDMQSKEG